MDLHRRFGRRLRQLRKRAGLTQEQLAEIVRLSSVSISNIERGVYAPAFRRLQDFAAAVNVDIHELFMLDGDSQ